MTRRKFSIIIPLYNKDKLIKKSLESVLSQEYDDFEIIVVDDGSTDSSASFVKQYEDKRLNYYYKENRGVSSARNFGIDKVTGDWLLFLDADDELLPNTLEHFNLLISRFPRIKVFVGQERIEKIATPLIVRKTNCPFLSMWLNMFYPRPGALLVHRDVINKYGQFDLRQSFYEDLDFGLRMLKEENVVYFNKQVVKYNQDGTGLSGSYHPLDKEMAYYIPEMIQSASFWHKALLFENLEQEIYWWQLHGSEENAQFYRDMQKKNFSRVFAVLHWIRQKMIRRGII